MNDRTDPWASAATATGYHDPFAAAMAAAEPRREASITREPQTFRLAPGHFIGPGTDPVAGGPNWEQGPRQRP